jgi:hypothetical protein
MAMSVWVAMYFSAQRWARMTMVSDPFTVKVCAGKARVAKDAKVTAKVPIRFILFIVTISYLFFRYYFKFKPS